VFCHPVIPTAVSIGYIATREDKPLKEYDGVGPSISLYISFSLLSRIYEKCEKSVFLNYVFCFPGKDYGSGSSGQYLQIPQPA
jgi:hypothetical protein